MAMAKVLDRLPVHFRNSHTGGSLLRGAAEDVRDEHWFLLIQYRRRAEDGRTAGLWCACGWFFAFEREAVRVAAEHGGWDMFQKLATHCADSHERDVLEQLNPTLSDYSDWGWFCPEAT